MHKQHFHFIGISGIGMSGIAKIFAQQGHIVSGCDQSSNQKHIQELQNFGCKIEQQHLGSLCRDTTINVVIYSTVISQDHPELVRARKLGITTLHRSQALAIIMQDKKNAIAISGSHGKTSTSALMSHLLIQADFDPTIIVGGHIKSINSNAHCGQSSYAVAEADESDRSLLNLPKQYSIVTNIDLEHLETYTDLQDIQNTFVQFINTTPDNGCNILCLDDPGIQAIMPQITKPIITYGQTEQADIQIKNIILEKDQSIFDIYQKSSNEILGSITLPIAGIQYVLNCVATIALGLKLGIPFGIVKESLLSFQGIDRRFSYQGLSKLYGAHIFDDYGHHPKEIDHVLMVARKKCDHNLIVAFQPHRYSRTKHLWYDFVQTFSKQHIDTLIITDIFPASEQPIEGITSQNLVEAIKKQNPQINVIYCPLDQNHDLLKNSIIALLQANDLLLFLGAGKIHTLAQKLL